jgi:toxin-antitoxin system PIN domain toxin
MSGVIDTNLLLLAANRDGEEHVRARQFLEQQLSAPGVCYLTEGICYEFMRVATHRKVFPRPLKASEAKAFLDAILHAGETTVLVAGSDHWNVLSQVINKYPVCAGNLFFGVRTVVLMSEYGISDLFTADTDFLQFEEINVVNPLLR